MIRYPRIQNIAPSARGYKKKNRDTVFGISSSLHQLIVINTKAWLYIFKDILIIQQINKTDKTYISDLGLENYKMFKVYQTGTFPPLKMKIKKCYEICTVMLKHYLKM